jgi:hypothetical protein
MRTSVGGNGVVSAREDGKGRRRGKRTVLARFDVGDAEVADLELVSAGLREDGGLELVGEVGLHVGK